MDFREADLISKSARLEKMNTEPTCVIWFPKLALNVNKSCFRVDKEGRCKMTSKVTHPHFASSRLVQQHNWQEIAASIGPDQDKGAENHLIFGQCSPIVSKSSIGRGSQGLRKLRYCKVNDGTAVCPTGSVLKFNQYNNRRFGKSRSVKGARKSATLWSQACEEWPCMDLTRRV